VKEQRRKAFDEAQRKALADASAALQAAGNGKPPAAAATADTPTAAAAAASGEVLTAQDLAGAVAGGAAGSSSLVKPGVDAAGGKAAGSGKAELEARVAYLQEAAKNYDDAGMSQFSQLRARAILLAAIPLVRGGGS
jgi:hypothetical protein